MRISSKCDVYKEFRQELKLKTYLASLLKVCLLDIYVNMGNATTDWQLELRQIFKIRK